ncbi:MAG TPA: acyl-CoA dehydrogenase family protein, partial [Acidimicrobiales bacterium]|nr:acyl-CoA dehydrogenase family protein [Acidimicrobiales bacterium]
MSIAITDDHRTLAKTVSDFLVKNGARGAARDLLEADSEGLPAFWADVAGLGWLGLHIPEEYGGSGFGLPELVVVVEELGRAVAPGPFVPSVITSAVIAATASADLKARLLPGLVDGSSIGSVALDATVEIGDGVAHGSAGVVLSGALANVVLVLVGEDVAIVDPSAGGVTVEV